MTKNNVIKTFIDVPGVLMKTLTYKMCILDRIKVPLHCDIPRGKPDC